MNRTVNWTAVCSQNPLYSKEKTKEQFDYEYPNHSKQRIVVQCELCKTFRAILAQSLRRGVTKCAMCTRRATSRSSYSMQLIALRKNIGLSQLDVALLLDIPASRYNQYEKSIPKYLFYRYNKIIREQYLVSTNVIRKCLKCDKSFPSRGPRICPNCSQENKQYYM